ncbi:MAG: hypothetical protein K2Z81_18230 [Cyanobacteria bacterium]|nr:hypothetical protein [Cyanobacteriota bacterium]
MNILPLVVILAPLIAALLTALPNRCVKDLSYKIGFWLFAGGFGASLPTLWNVAQTVEPTRVVLLASGWSVLPVVELSVDRLAATMMVVISGIGMLLYRYSTRYLQQDAGHARYQTLLSLSISTLLFMVSSADLVTLFVFWQLLSWFLCLLSHNYSHTPTAQSSFRTFIMLRTGDIAFLSAIALAYHLFGTVQFAQLFQVAAADQTRFGSPGIFEISGATAVTLLIFIGAMSKSAQFPFHMWLPDSLYAPTPIHALLHAGIINAGGFLLNRLAPLYAMSPLTLHLVLVTGLVTMIFGKCMMLSRNDIKKTLGYSTMGQMGYMIMECGFGAFSLAVFHLIAHGLFKATVFLNCGDVIHKARLEPERPPQPSTDPGPGILAWLAGSSLSLLLPLGIIVGTHYVLGISFLNSQGLLIFVLFSWVTAAHATLTLFRLGKGWPTITIMVFAVTVVSVAYFSSAEHFTHFLYPEPGIVRAYFQAAAVPDLAFAALAACLIVSIVVSWSMLYLHYHDKIAIRSGRLWSEFYLFFINRLYLDVIAMRLFKSLGRLGRTVDQSKASFPIIALAALVVAWTNTRQLPTDAMEAILLLTLSALFLPLFPLHGLYVSALTRAPRSLAVMLSVLLPIMGLFLIPKIPQELLPIVGVLSAFGAVWGSFKAIVQSRVCHLLAYAALALYSVLWWHLAQVGVVTPHAMLYALEVTCIIGGLALAWDRLRVRYGDLDLNQIGGLFRPMPRFALCMALLIMAGVGLPPFGLYFGYLGILLNPSTEMSSGLIAIIAAWFAASWYFFKLMQRLLFGPHRTDIRYEDLRPAEIAVLFCVIVMLVVPGTIPEKWLEGSLAEVTWRDGVSK